MSNEQTTPASDASANITVKKPIDWKHVGKLAGIATVSAVGGFAVTYLGIKAYKKFVG